VVEKNFPNSFRGTPLLEHLRGANAEDVVIVGAMSHMCIDATARAAFDHGFKCTVAENACATRALEFGGRTIPARDVHAAFMAALAVPYARVVPTEEMLREL
jgi:nicotinamidase-related amidase